MGYRAKNRRHMLDYVRPHAPATLSRLTPNTKPHHRKNKRTLEPL